MEMEGKAIDIRSLKAAEIPHIAGNLTDFPRLSMRLENKLRATPPVVWAGLRGRDVPLMKSGPRQERNFLGRQRCIVMHQAPNATGNRVLCTIGSLQEVKQAVELYVEFHLDTQMPAISFRIHHKDDIPIIATRFLADLKAETSDGDNFKAAFEVASASQLERKGWIPDRNQCVSGDRYIPDLIGDGKIWQLCFRFQSSTRPVWTHISSDEVNTITNDCFDLWDAGKEASIEPWKEFVWTLETIPEFVICLLYDHDQMLAKFKDFSDYFTGLADIVADPDFSNMWWYRAQLPHGKSLSSKKINFDELRDPFWLIQSAQVEFKDRDTIADGGIRVEEIGTFSPRRIMAGDDSTAFMHRLAVAREFAAARRYVESLYIDHSKQVSVRIFKDPNAAGKVVAAVFVEGVGPNESVSPSEGTRLIVDVQADKPFRIQGSVSTEYAEIGQLFLIAGHFENYKEREVDSNTSYPSQIEFLMDPLPSYRAMTAMYEANLPAVKTWGPDIGHLVLSKPKTVARPDQCRRKPLTEDLKKAYRDQINSQPDERFGLLNKQAALEFLDTPDGILIIEGGPGTSKTETILEMVAADLKHLDAKVLVCAPRNAAVEVLALRWNKRVDREDFLIFNLNIRDDDRSKPDDEAEVTNEDTQMADAVEGDALEDEYDFSTEHVFNEPGETDDHGVDTSAIEAVAEKVPQFNRLALRSSRVTSTYPVGGNLCNHMPTTLAPSITMPLASS